jgi:hypothetical protein
MISEMNIKKLGHNTYSNYDYFTPEQVSQMVAKACEETKLITFFTLEKNDLGYYGLLIVADLEQSGHQRAFTYHTEKPTIKATNVTQQIGGMITYTQRYAEMTAFGIVDNVLDFDSEESGKVGLKIAPPTGKRNPVLITAQKKLKSMTKKQFDYATKKIKDGMTVKETAQLKTWLTRFGEGKYKFEIDKLLKDE